jgi:septal ring factor EnvC (AmiA/AmiB activator)
VVFTLSICPTLTTVARAEDTQPASDLQARRRAEQTRLHRIQSEIEEIRAHLQQADTTAGSIVDALDEIDLRIALFRREAESLEFKADSARLAHHAAERRAAVIRRELDASEEAVAGWLREVYKSGPVRYLQVMAASTSPAEIASAQRVVETLSLLEGERIETLRADRARMDEALEELRTTRETLATLRAALAEREQEQLRSRREKTALLEQVRNGRSEQHDVMNELLQVEQSIQAMLSALRQADPAGMAVSRGFERFRGLLNRPAEGRLLVPFGNVKHPRFRTEVPHPGVDIACEPGSAVSVVFDGQVVFSDWFRGYGQLIVVDHADNYLSIYGHLGDRLMAVGQEVFEGDIIAHSGESGTLDTPALYFEIRHDGEPQDPSPWLRPE